MLLFATLLKGLALILGMLLNALFWIVIIYCVISWVNADPYNPVVRFLRATVDPMLKPLRRFIRPIGPGLDLTPLVLSLIIYFAKVVLVDLLLGYSIQLQRSAIESAYLLISAQA